LPGGTGDRGPRLLTAWRRTYGASPAHLLLHLAAITLIAWVLSQSFDARYSASYLNLAIWMVAGAIINDFVAIPLYVGADRAARGLWGRVRGPRPAGPRTAPRPGTVLGNGHVRVPLAMSAVLLLVYFPNIAHKAPAGHRLSTGLAEQPDYATRWLAITAGLMVASGLLHLARRALHRRPTATG
ncbi:hypothetical protein AB0L40_22730, partial [Patulibacter sp. NPDC049589]|uniref:hypothetical protein n=1 Tax=Patulibacter sp. NPDC049589 TaxID=3154731 RepID=UPI003420B29F